MHNGAVASQIPLTLTDVNRVKHPFRKNFVARSAPKGESQGRCSTKINGISLKLINSLSAIKIQITVGN